MPETDTADAAATAFVARWSASGASETSNAQTFLVELCDLLGVPHPDPASDRIEDNAYTFERRVFFADPSDPQNHGRIDLYRRGCFVLESKQGVNRRDYDQRAELTGKPAKGRIGHGTRDTRLWQRTMSKARNQAERYAKALPVADGWPPFLLVVDVGHCIDVYADFSRTGKSYLPFPDQPRYRVMLPRLADPVVRDTLRAIWTDPLSLDPGRRAAKVTRDVAGRLAKLAASFEGDGHDPETVAGFLMRCVFTMYAEDAGLLETRSFTELLESLTDRPDTFPGMVGELWQAMDRGGFSTALRQAVRRFNGSLFADAAALPVGPVQLELLIDAAKADWRDVEPAIFGTLLERALDPRLRHSLGAHYTPREYVERLVGPTLVEPLRGRWDAVQAAATAHLDREEPKKARKLVDDFLTELRCVTVLDPACGTGNFLYVALEHMKRLEAEVLAFRADLGEATVAAAGLGQSVDPHQFLGLEINPRAAAIAEVVLWIGYLQWQLRTGEDLGDPVLQDLNNIACTDAVLAYDARELLTDDAGRPVSRWDGLTRKAHPVTGQPVPDESARTPVYRYTNPRPADWPQADYIVGNPPFIGIARMREALGDGYAEAVRQAYGHLPASVDYVMYWWDKAATLTRAGACQRFGFITTNSIRQTFNRRVIERHAAPAGKKATPLTLVYAIPDHPWVDEADGAQVRIAMTAADTATPAEEGTLQTVTAERDGDLARAVDLETRSGIVTPALRIGANLGACATLNANENLSSRGVCLFGSGFIVTPARAAELGLGRVEGLDRHIRDYRNGRDLNQTPRGVMVIDLYGLNAEQTRDRFPEAYQHVYEHVKPERDQNNRAVRRENWWLFGETNPKLREMLAGLPRYIATTETSKHRFFQFLDASILPDNMLVNVALDDAFHLGVLSSRIHVTFALAAGGRLGVGNDPRYNKTRCFDPFPFPECDDSQKQRIRELGERLDAHRKRQQALHPKLKLTDVYNVLEKLRAGDELSAKDKAVHEQGLVAVLKEIHDDLDAAVAAAYGWPADLAEEEILHRLVALNAERAAEERRGRVRWLRPAYQNPEGVGPETQGKLLADDAPPAAATIDKQPWPKTMVEQLHALRTVLAALPDPADAPALSRCFQGHRKTRIATISALLEVLSSLGQIRQPTPGRYAA